MNAKSGTSNHVLANLLLRIVGPLLRSRAAENTEAQFTLLIFGHTNIN